METKLLAHARGKRAAGRVGSWSIQEGSRVWTVAEADKACLRRGAPRILAAADSPSLLTSHARHWEALGKMSHERHSNPLCPSYKGGPRVLRAQRLILSSHSS